MVFEVEVLGSSNTTAVWIVKWCNCLLVQCMKRLRYIHHSPVVNTSLSMSRYYLPMATLKDRE